MDDRLVGSGLVRAAVLLAGAVVAYRLWPRVELRGKTVLIVGGSRGLGLCLAREFARREARLVLAARDATELDAARREIRALGAEVMVLTCDVTDAAQAEALVAQVEESMGGLDVLVNAAGIISIGPLSTFSREDFERAMAVNFWGVVNACLAAVPSMRKRRSGLIVNVTSIGGTVSVPHLLPYCSAKFASVGFSEGLSVELRQDGIRVLTVIPGLMRTGSAGHARVKGQHSAEITWFSLSASAPLITLGADRAARRIVDACRRGERHLVLGWPAKLMRLVHALLPRTTDRVLALVNSRWLPAAGDASAGDPAGLGADYRTGVARSVLTALGDRAALRNNEELTRR